MGEHPPKIGEVYTDGQRFPRRVAQPDVGFVQAAITDIVGGGSDFPRKAVTDGSSFCRDVVAHGGEGAQSQTDTEVARQTETHGEIVELCRVTIDFGASGVEVGILQREADVHQERQRVDARQRCGVLQVELSSIGHTQPHTTHTFVEAQGAVGRKSQSVAGVGGSGARLLCGGCEGKCAPSNEEKYLLHEQ